MTRQRSNPDSVTLFLCGDVMTGRGVDQILQHPSAPKLYETWVASAIEYVNLAERKHGKIAKPVDAAYVWGDALQEFERASPDARIINLETAVTASNRAWPGKPIHYRMHPGNVGCLKAAAIDCCVLANNHTLDWGREGLEESLRVLREAELRTAGAGRTLDAAAQPARIAVQDRGSVLVFACGSTDSGVPADWSAATDRSGVWVLEDFSQRAIDMIAARVRGHRQPRDIVVMSLHWGSNWGYAVGEAHRMFAHGLIDAAGVDVVYGHSSHHPIGIEFYRGKLILYGCGDFLNDYEGIEGYESFRPDLSLMYFPTIAVATGELVELRLTPTYVQRMQVHRANRDDARWLCDVLNREGRRLGTHVELLADGRLMVMPL